MNSRKAMTVLAILIVLSLVVMPATAFAAGGKKVVGTARITRYVNPGPSFEFRINAKQLNKWPYAEGFVYKRNLSNGRVQKIANVSFAKVKNCKAFVGGRGSGKWTGKYVMIAIVDNDGNDKLYIRTTKSRWFYKQWRLHPTKFGNENRWVVYDGDLDVKTCE